MNPAAPALLCVGALLGSWVSVAGQLPPLPSAPLHSAYYAMSEGRYIEGLEEYLRILRVARDTSLMAEVAVQTGELYRVSQVAPNGQGLVVSRAGGLLAFRTDTVGARKVEVYRVGPSDGATALSAVRVADLEGSRVALWGGTSSVGRAAYLSQGDASAMEGARLQMERARQRRSTLEFEAARRQLEFLAVSTAELRVLELATGVETVVALDGHTPIDWGFAEGGELLVAASLPGESGSGLFRADATGALERLDRFTGYIGSLLAVSGGRTVVIEVPIEDPAPHRPGSLPSPRGEVHGVGIIDIETGQGEVFVGVDPVVSADGSTLAFLTRPEGYEPDRMRHPHGPSGSIQVVRFGDGPPRTLWTSDRPLTSLALSPDGSWVAYSELVDRDWEVSVRPTRSSQASRRVTNEIQHDLNSVFVGRGTLLATKGERRHRRAYLYDFAGGPPLKLFDNNLLRTLTPEYEWTVGPSGDWVAIVADRDGDTVSREQGVYLVDLTRRVDKETLLARLEANLEREKRLAAMGVERFAAIHDSVGARVSDISTARLYGYQQALHSFGSKYITEPGNRRARDYLVRALRGFGYTPIVQEFEALPGVSSANVVATLTGTEDPALTYVISSHFDSSRRGAGADDNTSGTAALLETARVLARHPQRASIQFVFLTGEEAGLLGARHYVQRARASNLQVVGVLNNDMVGWANDHRLDNTIRYSSDGIRDVQHAAAGLYSELITYDTKYYKNTDAHVFFDAYGDIVGGIGSYPILGNPNYHQSTDRIETVNHRLIAEVSRTTVATIMALAYGPSRPSGLAVQRLATGELRVSWKGFERAIRSYQVRYRADRNQEWTEVTSRAPAIELPALPDGAEIEVASVTATGVLSWDRARATVGGADVP